MTTIAAAITILVGLWALLMSPFSRSVRWRAAVTPLASIIGSGFLVSAPLLAREFGGYAVFAMTALIIVAALIGKAIRYNIRVVEPQLSQGGNKALGSLEEISHFVLALAYFISVAYYLSLLGNFVLEAAGTRNVALARGIAIALVAALGLLGWTGGVKRIARVERYTTALNLAVIFGFLVALAVFDGGLVAAGKSVLPSPGHFSLQSVPVLMGLLIVVQGFETSRFMGADFDAGTRIRAMRLAQGISAAVYILFFLLLSPLFAELEKGTGVATIITVSGLVAAALPLSLTVAATASQFSASVADSLGDEGLLNQLTRGRLDARHAYALIAVVGIAILLSLDVEKVIAIASRAFALFYALQCLVAWEAARKRPEDRRKAVLFLGLALVCAAVLLFGVPSSG